MTEPEVFVLADHTLLKVVNAIRDEQWDMMMPDKFMMRDKKPITLRSVINYHAYDDAWVPAMLAGKTMEEVGKEEFKGDLLGNDPKAAFAAIVEKACEAARNVTDLQQTAHLSFGDYPIQHYFWQINLFRGLRAHDIAKVLGQDTTLPADLVQGIWDEVSPQAEEWRTIGVFGPKVEVSETDTLQNKLLGLTGRPLD